VNFFEQVSSSISFALLFFFPALHLGFSSFSVQHPTMSFVTHFLRASKRGASPTPLFLWIPSLIVFFLVVSSHQEVNCFFFLSAPDQGLFTHLCRPRDAPSLVGPLALPRSRISLFFHLETSSASSWNFMPAQSNPHFLIHLSLFLLARWHSRTLVSHTFFLGPKQALGLLQALPRLLPPPGPSLLWSKSNFGAPAGGRV